MKNDRAIVLVGRGQGFYWDGEFVTFLPVLNGKVLQQERRILTVSRGVQESFLIIFRRSRETELWVIQ